MKISNLTIQGAIIFSLLIVVAHCTRQNPERLVKNYENVYNSHDVEKLMSLYSAEAVFEVVGLFKFSDMDKIMGVAQYDSALDITMEISNIEVRGDTAFFKLKETNNWLNAMGIDAAYYDPAYIVFYDGLITYIKATATDETNQAFQEAFAEFMPWAKQNAPERLAEMMPEGKFIYNAENAKKAVMLINDFKASLKEIKDK